jgi:hypothetical protein
MSNKIVAPSTEPLEAILVERRRIEQEVNPDVSARDYVVLKNGPKVYKVATHWVIVDRHTGELHHHAVKIETYKRLRTGWMVDDEHSITLDDSESDAITSLATFLGAIRSVDIPQSPGHYLVMPVSNHQVSNKSVRQLLNAISNGGKANVIAEALATANGDPDVLQDLVSKAVQDPYLSRQAAAVLNIAHYSQALSELRQYILDDADENKYQRHLAANPWMFGSEYSELLDRRKWTRDEQQDFMLRRTADGYLELIEIKTALRGKDLFVRDSSHDTLYPRSELSEVLGQVLHYLEKLDANRHTIKFDDGEDVNKIRAKIIIGRTGDNAQASALRRLNGHLHRVEILTFDQLATVAGQVVKSLENVLNRSQQNHPSNG